MLFNQAVWGFPAEWLCKGQQGVVQHRQGGLASFKQKQYCYQTHTLPGWSKSRWPRTLYSMLTRRNKFSWETERKRGVRRQNKRRMDERALSSFSWQHQDIFIFCLTPEWSYLLYQTNIPYMFRFRPCPIKNVIMPDMWLQLHSCSWMLIWVSTYDSYYYECLI